MKPLGCCSETAKTKPKPLSGLLGVCSTCGTVLCWDGRGWFYDRASNTKRESERVAALEERMRQCELAL